MSSEFRILRPEQPREVVDPKISHIADDVAAAAAARTPVQTGRLARSWRSERVDTARYRVVNDTPYGRYVEHGTRYDRAQPMLAPAMAEARARYGR